jgi:molybdopterin/thiamine biosynthesis adenylyltransferase
MHAGKHVVVIGAGGNIGSHLVPHLARMPEVGRLTLVDRDVYEARNIVNQEMPAGAAFRKKAVVQAARARRINPRAQVRALAEDVETVPLGALRGDLILACLDSRRARQRVNEAAGRLGVPWLDGGVLGKGMLARVTRYAPGGELPCLECSWDDADYAAIEQSYPCEGNGPAPTTAPSSLGALAAALQAIECRKLLTGQGEPLPPGSQLLVDAAHHRQFVTAVRRNPDCRRADHTAWSFEPLPGGHTARLGTVLESARRRPWANGRLTLRVEGKRFVRAVSCEDCGATRRVLRLAGTLRRREHRCSRCGGRLLVAGFGLTEHLDSSTLTRVELQRRLVGLGLRIGDVLSIGSAEREWHWEIAPA